MTFTSDEQRREVAQKLRALDMSDIEVDGCIIDSPKYVGLLLMRMLDAACDYRDGLHHFPGFFSAQAVVELFVDLIDSPTCTIVCECDAYSSWGERIDGMRLYELSCGHQAVGFEKPRYCPECGMEVVKRD